MTLCKFGPILVICATLAAQEPGPSLESFLVSSRSSYAKGDYKTSRAALEQAWSLAEQLPAESPKRYDVLKQHYAVASAAGQYEDAEKFLQLAINWRENAFGREHPKVADDLVELAMLCRNLKDIPRALSILSTATSMYERASGTQSVTVADSYSRMALLHMEDHQPERAAGVLRIAIVIRENLLGADHVGLLPELIRLGTIRVALREYEKAEQVYRNALVIHERALGPGNPDLIPTVEGLAYALFGQKKYSEAEPYYLRLIDLWLNAGGKNHPMLALTLDKLAVFYREQERRPESDSARVRANVIRAIFYASGLSESALVELTRGNKDEAAHLYRRAANALDPNRIEHQELLMQIETNLKGLEPMLAKPVQAAPGKKTPSRGNRKP